MRPILDLPPVELPPAPASAPVLPSTSGRALLAVGSLVLLVVLGAALFAALVTVNLWLLRSGTGNGILIFVTAAAGLALLRVLAALFWRPPDPESEVPIDLRAEPDLARYLISLARDVGVDPPGRVVVVSEPNAYVREFGALMGLARGERTLAIGAPLLDALDVSELTAVLAHEMGHLAGGDTRFGPLASRTDMALERVVATNGRSPVGIVYLGFARIHRRLMAAVTRRQELVADLAAVRIAGRQAAADALRDAHVVAAVDAELRHRLILPLLRTGRRPADVKAGLRGLLGDPVAVGRHLTLDHDDDELDPYATHPPTSTRIERIGELPEVSSPPRDGRAAHTLLRDADRWIDAAHERLLVLAGVEAFERVPWSAWGALVLDDEQRARAVDVDVALGRLGERAGVAGLRDVVAADRGRELAAELVSSGWRAAPGLGWEPLVRGAIVARASVTAVDAGTHRWTVSWSEPVGLTTPAGTPLGIGALADDALHGRWDGLLAALGETPTDVPLPEAADPVVAPVAAGAPLGLPPRPPFERAPDGSWEAVLPGLPGRRVRLRIAEHGLELRGTEVAFDDIAHVTIHLRPEEASRPVVVRVTTADGRTIRARPSAASTSRNGQIIDAALYLADVVVERAGARLRARIADEVRAGRDVAVGDLVVSQEGVRPRRRGATVPWSSLGDPILVLTPAAKFVVPVRGGRDLVSSTKRAEAFLLPTLVPQLRALLG